MSAVTQPITLEAFLARPEREDGLREELIEGEIVLSPAPKPIHAQIVQKLQEALAKLEEQGFVLRQNFGVIMAPNSMPGPDLAAIRSERWEKAIQQDAYPTGSPELVIEVRSPSNRQLGRKATVYLENGAEAVWIVNPKRRAILVYDQEGVRKVRENEQLVFRGITLEASKFSGDNLQDFLSRPSPSPHLFQLRETRPHADGNGPPRKL